MKLLKKIEENRSKTLGMRNSSNPENNPDSLGYGENMNENEIDIDSEEYANSAFLFNWALMFTTFEVLVSYPLGKRFYYYYYYFKEL
jgi:hypothetical protein